MSAGSARGLFRATGNTAKPVAVRTLDGDIVKTDGGIPRDEHDFNPTPPEPTRALLAVELARLREFSVLWEPACGDGAMVREMLALGFGVAASDMIDRGCGLQRSFYDFTPETKPERAALVTNPPFKECNTRDGQARWLWHALDVLNVEYMALLLNWSWPGAGGLASFWAKYPPARVYLMRWKIDFTGQGAPPMLNGWFVWDRKSQGETVLRMLDRADARQRELTFEETVQSEIPAPAETAAASEALECDEGRDGPETHDDSALAVSNGVKRSAPEPTPAVAEVQQCASAAPVIEAGEKRDRLAEISKTWQRDNDAETHIEPVPVKPDEEPFEIPEFLRRKQTPQAEAA